MSRSASRPPRCGRTVQWRRLAAIIVASALLVLPACARTTDTAALQVNTEALRVYAAASLNPVLTEIAEDYVAQYPDRPVAPPVFDGSATLVTQITEGAPADLVITADVATLDRLGDRAEPARVIARNELMIAVAPGNPHHVETLADLADPALSVVLCAPEVPCGAAATVLLTAANVTLDPASSEQNVTAVLRKVELGDADAGLVYRTDVAHSTAVLGLPILGSEAAMNDYPAAVIAGSEHLDAARAFLDYLGSEAARKRLSDAGFLPPA